MVSMTAVKAIWPVTFPGNLRWSNATQIVKGMVAYGAAAMAEIDLIVQRLKARARRGRSRQRLDGGMVEGGRPRRRRSATRPTPRATPSPPATSTCAPATTTTAPSASSRRATRSSRSIARRCAATRARWRGCIPTSSASRCPTRARACRPGSSKAAVLGKRPTVVLFDGMDNAKEMSVIFAGLDFAKRGINTLAIDGPGQSEPLRLRNIPTPPRLRGRRHSGLRLRRRAAGRRPQARRRDGLQLRRLSCAAHLRLRQALRGLRLLRRHALEHLRLRRGPRSLPIRARPQPRPSSGAGWSARPTTRPRLEWAKKFTLEGVADKVECPILILHGENDRVVPLAEANKLYERVGSKKQDLRIFTEAEGGAEHCQVDNRQLGVDFIGDWLLKNHVSLPIRWQSKRHEPQSGRPGRQSC